MSCVLVKLLIGCAEPRLEPLTPTKNPDEHREHQSDSSSFMHKEASPPGIRGQCLLYTVRHSCLLSPTLFFLHCRSHDQSNDNWTGGEAATTDQCHNYKTAVRQYPRQPSIEARLHQVGEEQHVLHLDVDELHNKQERLEEENLRNTVQQLTSKSGRT